MLPDVTEKSILVMRIICLSVRNRVHAIEAVGQSFSIAFIVYGSASLVFYTRLTQSPIFGKNNPHSLQTTVAATVGHGCESVRERNRHDLRIITFIQL
ncbi:hypothetical protein TNCV_1462971 [Trichonephila clavipes]|uniref:Uncharacterized protein n=1 Tax=Trichonephila clavipes TaxID=2585209 RepID=A0A8X6SJR6_TRICX|nr:hypothetical protein TNCV_1462971 [Trichonephila clavipes]